jgi:hypothetical protein
MDILRDTPFGQACRLVSRWHLFQYPEERYPTYIQSCLGNLDEAEKRERDGREEQTRLLGRESSSPTIQ